MSTKSHWDNNYESRAPADMSWFSPHLSTSLDWILDVAPSRSTSIVDVGGGDSTLVDDLLAAGYTDVTIVDISGRAIEKSRLRLQKAAETVQWLIGDVTRIPLPAQRFHVWHDRATFHFLVEAEERRSYVRQMRGALQPAGHAILATFGQEGPERCSGLPVCRYDACALQAALGSGFRLIDSSIEQHRTPFGTTQQFQYCHFAVD